MLAEAARTLRPGGKLLIVDMMPHERTDFIESMGHLWPGFDAESITSWGRDAGFASIAYHPLPADPAAKGPTLFAAVAVKPRDTDNRTDFPASPLPRRGSP